MGSQSLKLVLAAGRNYVLQRAARGVSWPCAGAARRYFTDWHTTFRSKPFAVRKNLKVVSAMSLSWRRA
jgi:hypothetical protein